MRRIIYAGLGAVAAFACYSLLLHVSFPLTQLVNIFSLAVVFFAVREGEIFGAIYGMTCGLIFDAFSSGVFGVAGIAKTVTGYLAGAVSRRIDVTSLLRQLIFHSLLFALELLIWIFLYSLVFGQPLTFSGGLILLQPFVTAISASALFVVINRWLTARMGR